MEQLEVKVYSRPEMADILGLDITDTRHFKRNVENKLASWGYGVVVNRKNIEITSKPTTAEERLSEIFIRGFGIDVRADIYSMACFIVMLMDYEDFQSMPWDVRVEELEKEFGVGVAASTLKKWNAKLINKELISKCKYDRTAWATMYIDGKKERMMITGDEALEAQMKQYMEARKQLIADYKAKAFLEENRTDYEKINSEAWSYAYKMLWEEHHCCYYYCCSFYLNAIGEYAQEIYELVDEISYRKKPYREPMVCCAA